MFYAVVLFVSCTVYSAYYGQPSTSWKLSHPVDITPKASKMKMTNNFIPSCVKCDLFLATSPFFFFLNRFLLEESGDSFKEMLAFMISSSVGAMKQGFMLNPLPFPVPASVCTSACLDDIRCLSHGLLFLYRRQ